MTPTCYCVFLLALVGCTASVPRPLVVDACALLCNPGAETESEQERDPLLFPRYPKVNCKLQSESDEHQAWVIASHCLKLCATELSISSEVNCFALRSSLQANLGCYCEALSPLSPNTMRLHESWRLNYLVKEVADDIITVILNSPLDTLILCDLHQELFSNVTLKEGKLVAKCEPKEETETIITSTTTAAPERVARSVDAEEIPEHESPEWLMEHHEEIPEHESAEWLMDHHKEENTDDFDEAHYMQKLMEELMEEKKKKKTTEDVPKAEVIHQMMLEESLRKKLAKKKPEKEVTDSPQLHEFISEWKRVCSTMCKYESGNKFCQCHNPHLDELSDT